MAFLLSKTWRAKTWRAALAAAVFSILGLGFGAAEASDCARNLYMHNGSQMDWSVCDGGRTVIQYVEPRPGLSSIGVESGTVLFLGKEGPPNRLQGDARIFDGKCGTAKYPVAGRIKSDRTIVLKGHAPVRNSDCEVVRHRPDTLVFTLNDTAETDGPEVVQPSCPQGFEFVESVCVRKGNVPELTGRQGDWYAIALASPKKREAQRKANQLGVGWYVMNTDRCPNFTNGYWVATAGPFERSEAVAYAGGPGRDAYVKRCR